MAPSKPEPVLYSRCRQCCEHGVSRLGHCGWCEDIAEGYYEAEGYYDCYIPETEPMWRCEHGIGVKV